MSRSSFTLIELLVVIAILVVVTAITTPLYRNYRFGSDLDLAQEQVVQGLRRAQLLSRAGANDSQWGFSIASGVLYKGSTYVSRDTAFDEQYSIPASVAVSGIVDVSFSRVNGYPSGTGEVILETASSSRRFIVVGNNGVISVR